MQHRALPKSANSYGFLRATTNSAAKSQGVHNLDWEYRNPEQCFSEILQISKYHRIHHLIAPSHSSAYFPSSHFFFLSCLQVSFHANWSSFSRIKGGTYTKKALTFLMDPWWAAQNTVEVQFFWLSNYTRLGKALPRFSGRVVLLPFSVNWCIVPSTRR